MNGSTDSLTALARQIVARAAGVVGLMGIALIHVLDLPDTITGTPYIGVMYLALIGGTVVCAAELVRSGDWRAWAGAGSLAAMAFGGYCVSRSIGLPGDSDDIGNWLQPLGLASLFVEAAVVALGAYAVALARAQRRVPAMVEARPRPRRHLAPTA